MKKHAVKLLIILFALSLSAGTELADYVAKKDLNWSWIVHDKRSSDKGDMLLLRMTSQQWLTEKEVDQPLWKHGMVVYIPKRVKHSTALLMIGGGSSNINFERLNSNILMEIALRTKSVTAKISNIPNQPLVFADDPEKRQRVEDEILAFQWAKFLKKQDPEQLALLPMVKSVVRAMDTVSALCAGDNVEKPITVQSFVLSGKSKRGWTTWLTGAVDKRVVAIAPQVIDLLNMQTSFKHHKAVYGKYAPAVHDYVENGIMAAIDAPESAISRKILDPFSYRKVLTMPKMIINSSGDQFFLPDSSRFYFDKLPDPKYLRYIPNCGHGLDRSERHTLLSFYSSVLNKTPMPQYEWNILPNGQIEVSSSTKPMTIKLWQVYNPKKRDFRVNITGKTWTNKTVTPVRSDAGNTYYSTKVKPPSEGWRAFFLELVFADKVAKRVSLTTEVSVLPDELSPGISN